MTLRKRIGNVSDRLIRSFGESVSYETDDPDNPGQRVTYTFRALVIRTRPEGLAEVASFGQPTLVHIRRSSDTTVGVPKIFDKETDILHLVVDVGEDPVPCRIQRIEKDLEACLVVEALP